MFRTIDPIASTTLQSYEHRQLLHRARRYVYIKGAVNAVIALLFVLTFPPALRPKMVAIVLADALLLVPYWFLVQRYPTLATGLSLGLTSLAISAGDWVGGYQTGASGILYALLILGGHLVLIKPLKTYLISALITTIYVGTMALEMNGLIPIHFPFTLSNLLRVVSLNVISMLGLTILTSVVTRLYRELLQRNKELFALNAVSTAASQSLNLDRALHLTLDRVLEVMELQGGGLYLLEASTGKMVLRVHRNLPGEFVGWLSGMESGIEGFTDSPLRRGQVLVVDDLSQHPVMSETVSDGKGHRPLAIVPLKAQDRVLGVMNLLGPAGYAFTSQDVELLNTIGAQVGLAIENARWYEVEQHQHRIAEALRETAGTIGSTLELNEVLPLVLEQLRKVIDYSTSSIMMLEGDRLKVIAVEGFTDPEEILERSYTAKEVGLSWEVIRKKQALVVADITKYPRWIYEPQIADVRAWIGTPLIADGEVIGLLTMDSYQVGKYSQDDARLVMTFASQAALAIKNAQLYEREQQRTAQLTLVNQVARQVVSILDLDQLLDEVVTDIQQGFNYHHIGLFLLDEVAGQLEMRAIAGSFADMAPPDHRLALGKGMAGWTALTGQPLLANDVSQEPRYVLGILKEALTKAELCVPLKLAGKVIGVLDVQDTQLNAFDESDLLAMETLADQIAMAIENARIYEEERKRVNQLELIGEVTQKIASILNLDELLPQVARMIVDTFDYYHTSILLVEADSGELVLRASIGSLKGALRDRLRLKIGREGITGWVAHSGEPLLANDVSREPRYCFREEAKDIKSELAVPIKLKGEIIGVLDAQSIELDAFSQDDVSVLQTLADQLAIAIENARLYQQTDEKLQTRVKELCALYAIAEAVNESLDLDKVLHLALDSAIEVAGMDSGGILLLNPSISELFLRAHRGVPPEFIQAVSHPKADVGLMPRMLNSVLTIDDLSKVTKDCRRAIEKEGLQSLVSIPLKTKENLLGVMIIASHSPRPFASQELELLAAIGNQVGVAVDRANLQARELKAAILEERQATARHMHDDTVQTLGYLGLQVDSVMSNPSLAQNVKVQTDLEEIRKAIEDAYERVRSSITQLEENINDYFDLEDALPEIISEFEKQTRCRVESKVEESQLPRLAPAVAFQAIYIIREALTNVGKHSGATSVHLTFQGLENGRVEVTIQDNGRGFDLHSEQQAGRGGYGLRFMRERAERVGGSLRIESQPGQGTRVVVSLPSGKGG
jgi:GAF domain-containing protein/two-component sensor histidine kinase